MIAQMNEKVEPSNPRRSRFFDRLPLVPEHDPREERANTVTHALAFAASLVAVMELLRLGVASRSLFVVASLSVFGFTLLNLYFVSTIYHLLHRGRTKRLFRLLDHVSILYLIAGSYTVVLSLFLHGRLRWVMLVLEWGFAVAGTVYKVFFLGRFRGLSIGLYLLMGWLALIALPRMIALEVGELNLWLLLGGIAYMLGLIFFGSRRIPYHHAVWHLFVIAGSTFHVIGIYEATKLIYG